MNAPAPPEKPSSDTKPAEAGTWQLGGGQLSAADGDPPSRRPRSDTGFQFLQWLVAIIVIGGFLVGLWGVYRQGWQAGADAEAPLIASPAGPTKIKPADPGGMPIPHQDSQIWSALSGDDRPPRVERLLPLPEEPVARPTPAPRPEPPAQADAPPAVPDGDDAPSGTAVARAEPAAVPSERQEPRAAPGSGIVLDDAPAAPAAADPDPAPLPADPPDRTLGSIQLNNGDAGADGDREPARPAADPPPAPTLAPTPVPTPAPAPTGSIVLRPQSDGAYRVQLASVRSEDGAASEWRRLVEEFPDLLTDLTLFVERADLGDRGVFFRVQAGQLSEEAARGLCDALEERDAGCLTVRRP